ncbi:hypothetical protein B0T26DRAFT_752812 [Lasiosphaeria miniovina]|uniref:Uncharacterized protein n=1 Tax=Lasiosphaeria miniovina TaxID=1954250 RepID=A0AA40DUT0_9PEZI|nr:uncharacterized protein B0T26DRAFT_752812 [Lasiosphaeria miniovina]KAK0712593.1 hypothetical protein B0T26DRAFT_752812 [Lasiosphaeria miniovina]
MGNHNAEENRSTFYNITILGLCNLAAPGIWGAINSRGMKGKRRLYVNNRFGNEWLVLLGAALCGVSAGVFWMAEAAVVIAYPESWNCGKALGYWLTFRLAGQIVGGAINLGLNAGRDEAGKVSYTVLLVFIALQATGPFVGLLLNKPDQVERKHKHKQRPELHKWRACFGRAETRK